MYVCICKNITDTDIKRTIDDSASSMKDLQDTLSIGVSCGRCIEYVENILKEYKPT